MVDGGAGPLLVLGPRDPFVRLLHVHLHGQAGRRRGPRLEALVELEEAPQVGGGAREVPHQLAQRGAPRDGLQIGQTTTTARGHVRGRLAGDSPGDGLQVSRDLDNTRGGAPPGLQREQSRKSRAQAGTGNRTVGINECWVQVMLTQRSRKHCTSSYMTFMSYMKVRGMKLPTWA